MREYFSIFSIGSQEFNQNFSNAKHREFFYRVICDYLMRISRKAKNALTGFFYTFCVFKGSSTM